MHTKEMLIKRLSTIKLLYKIGLNMSYQNENVAFFSVLTFHDSYETLNTFWQKWEKFDIDNDDPVSNNYHLLSYDFSIDLHAWILERKEAGFI